MQPNTWLKPTMSLLVSLVLLMGLAAMPAAAQVQRVIFASAGFDETNRLLPIGVLDTPDVICSINHPDFRPICRMYCRAQGCRPSCNDTY
jgi:hypothetical protein